MVLTDIAPAMGAKLNALRAEFADLAFALERQGRRDAADIANQLGGRLAEFAAEFDPAAPQPTHTARSDLS